MNKLRWWLFKKISRIGWAICPEPQRTELYMNMRFDPNWKSYLPKTERTNG